MVTTGNIAPNFTLFNTKREPVTLESYRGKKVVLAFFPGAFSGVCERELCSFRDSMAAYNDLNAVVLGISVDAPASNGAFAEKNKLSFQLLSDYNREVIRTYDVVHEGFGGLPGYVAAKRSVFVLDAKGVVRYAWVAPEPKVEPDYNAVRLAVESA